MILNKQSGVLGMSGVSSDFRDIIAAANEGNEDAHIAFDVLIYRIVKYIGAYYMALGGARCNSFYSWSKERIVVKYVK